MFTTLSTLIHAEAKVGKSTFGGTSPPPILIFDAEGSTKFLPLRMIPWDPMRQPPPMYDGTWDAAVVVVHSIDYMTEAHRWLMTGQHHFRSLVVDSISEIQRKLRNKLYGTEQLKQQHWGQLLAIMDMLIRDFRNLTQHPIKPFYTVTFIAETKLSNGKWGPSMQGAIANQLPYFVDVVGYLYAEPVVNSAGQQQYDQRGNPEFVRRLLIGPSSQFVTGERVQARLPYVIDHPSVRDMLVTIFPQLLQEGVRT